MERVFTRTVFLPPTSWKKYVQYQKTKQAEELNDLTPLMKPPLHIVPIETDLHSIWFENDIVHSIAKADVDVTVQRLEQTFDLIKDKFPGKRVCWISDMTSITAPGREARDYAAAEGVKFIKALALITNSVLSRTVAEIFLLVKKPSYPVRLFTNVEDAKSWLKTMTEI